jgi:hypothetical protein
MNKLIFPILCLTLSLLPDLSSGITGRVNGKVFLDTNGNGIRDNGEKLLKGISVSNGKEVVRTDLNGNWELPAEDGTCVFVIKPAGFAVPLNKTLLPQYYRHHDLNMQSESIDFPLLPAKEAVKFSVLLFGDTQARGLKEVNYINHDVVEECISSGAVFGVELGDITADGPELFPEISQGIAQTSIPWYYIFGNHDFDRSAKTVSDKYLPFEKYFGPSTYAFEYAKVVFIALNNIYFLPNGRYISRFTDDQLSFVKNYLAFVPKEKLIVLMMHSPIAACDNREKMFRLIENRPFTFSVSGHLHEQVNLFLGKKGGWQGTTPHHHLINATACGSWWCGTNDERGIPHATMNDGAPNGYSVITFDGNQYRIRFKAAGRPENYQMNIYLPDDIDRTVADTTNVLVNVFAGSEKSKVNMQVDKISEVIPLEHYNTADPGCMSMYRLSPYLKDTLRGKLLEDVFGYTMDYPSISRHIWEGILPSGLTTGTHTIKVTTTDMFNQTWTAYRVFRIK